MQILSNGQQTTQSKPKSYLKLTIDSIELSKNLSFIPLNKKNNDLEINLNLQYSCHSNNQQNNKKITQVKLNQIKNSNKSSQQQQQILLFQPLTDRYDCINLTQILNQSSNRNNINNNVHKHQLKINYQIINKQTNQWLDTIMIMSKNFEQQKKLKQKQQISKQNQFQSTQKKQKSKQKQQISQQKKQTKQQKVPKPIEKQPPKKYTQVLYSSQQITLPIDKIFKQAPYLINQLTLDITIDNKEKQQLNKQQTVQQNNNNIQYNNNTIKQQASKQQQTILSQSKQKPTSPQQKRQGIINLTIIYLPQIKPQILFKNVTLKTKLFNKGYKLIVKQFIYKHQNQKQSLLKSNVKKQSLKEKIEGEELVKKDNYIKNHNNNNNISTIQQSKAQLTNKSKKRPYNKQQVSTLQIPLQPTDWKNFQNPQSHQQQQGISMPLILHNNLDQIQFLLSYEKKKQKTGNVSIQKKSVKLKTATIDKLYRVKNKRNQWSHHQIKYQTKNIKNQQQSSFQLKFMFDINMNIPRLQNKLNQQSSKQLSSTKKSQQPKKIQINPIEQSNPFGLVFSAINNNP